MDFARIADVVARVVAARTVGSMGSVASVRSKHIVDEIRDVPSRVVYALFESFISAVGDAKTSRALVFVKGGAGWENCVEGGEARCREHVRRVVEAVKEGVVEKVLVRGRSPFRALVVHGWARGLASASPARFSVARSRRDGVWVVAVGVDAKRAVGFLAEAGLIELY